MHNCILKDIRQKQILKYIISASKGFKIFWGKSLSLPGPQAAFLCGVKKKGSGRSPIAFLRSQ